MAVKFSVIVSDNGALPPSGAVLVEVRAVDPAVVLFPGLIGVPAVDPGASVRLPRPVAADT